MENLGSNAGMRMRWRNQRNDEGLRITRQLIVLPELRTRREPAFAQAEGERLIR